MRNTTLETWLDELASAAPAPGGGAAAAINASMGAALVSMVCNLTIGKPKFADFEETASAILIEAEELRAESLQLAEDDATAFNGVIAAYKLPKDTDDEKQARTAAIQTGLVRAAQTPLEVCEVAAKIIKLCGRVLDYSNPNVVSDVAVAASAARSALESAVVNVDINLASIKDMAAREAIAGRLNSSLQAKIQAEAIIVAVMKRIKK